MKKASQSPSAKNRRMTHSIPTSKQPASAQTRGIDIWLSRFSKIAQVATPILAVLGFWYTVLPLYSKAMLEEQVAKSHLELEAQRKELVSLELSIKGKQNESDALMQRIQEEESKSSTLQSEIAELSHKRLKAERSAQLAKQSADRSYGEMRGSVITAALNDAEICATSILPWSRFYSAALREWTRDASPPVIGERYQDLDGIVQCIGNKALEGYGISQLQAKDLEVLKIALHKDKPTLDKRLKEIDSQLSDDRDAFLSSKIILDEYKGKYKSQDRYLSLTDEMQARLKSANAAQEVARGHIERNSFLAKSAMKAVADHIDKMRLSFRQRHWIE